MKRRLFGLIIVARIVSRCTTVNQIEDSTGGYSETQLVPDIFRVTFRGNGYKSSERALDTNLLRSAELAAQNGFNYFIMIDSDQYSSESTYTTPTTSVTKGEEYIYDGYATGNLKTVTYQGGPYHISKPRLTNTIICFSEKPAVSGMAFDSEFPYEFNQSEGSIPSDMMIPPGE